LRPAIDPRRGDIEDDASSSKRRSLLSLAGSLLAEISITKLATAWLSLVILPALLLGVAPIVASIWFNSVFDEFTSSLAGVWSLAVVILLAAIGWFGGRRVLQIAEHSFWSLNSLIVQPCYTACREVLRHLVGGRMSSAMYAGSAVASALFLSAIAVGVVLFVWPEAYLTSDITILRSPKHLAIVALANSVVLVGAYVAVAVLVWGVADAAISQPRNLELAGHVSPAGRTWRIAHLSDLHIVGERYGFRIESGRSGPRGNGRWRRLLDQLELIHASEPLDVVLITGDMTDAGRSGEWAEFFDAIADHPSLSSRILLLPGNHDVNIVDRANPARLDLPTSPNKRLRKVRALSALAAIQGERVRIVDRAGGRLGASLAATLEPHLPHMIAFADAGKPSLTKELADLWDGIFPMVLPPEQDDGLGIMLLNSNADTHFSFTNALGMISSEQARAINIVSAAYPRAGWVIALHHHVVEYPWGAKALSERIGTALINGSWFVRGLKSLAGRAVLMHGHRHIDWLGQCAGLMIVSAPSPVMNATDDAATYFYVHTLAIGSDRHLRLLQPQRVVVAGEAPSRETVA
jgi:Calcineurin-like phosphoesterase